MIYELMSYLYTQRYVQYKDEGCVWFQCFFAYNKHLRGFFLNVHASEDPAKFLSVSKSLKASIVFHLTVLIKTNYIYSPISQVNSHRGRNKPRTARRLRTYKNYQK